MKYSELGLKTNTETTKVVTINDKEISVLQYLPMEDKIDLIQIVLDKAYEDGVYNEMKIDMYFYLYLVFMYTDLEFTDEEKMNEALLFDELYSNGVIDDVVALIEEDEYNALADYLETMKAYNINHHNSAAALLQSFIQDLPKNAEAAAAIVDSFDKDKYPEVVNFARSANGGRPI